MYSRLIALPLLAGTLQASAAALSRRTPEPASFQSKSMRVAFTAVSDPYGFKNDDLQGDSNVAYIANITIAGQQFQVQLDTGSADLWVSPTSNFTGVNDTGIADTISYGDTSSASGNVYLGAVTFGNFSLPSQAFINAPGSNATGEGYSGILGLGPQALSTISTNLQNSSFNGNTTLNNIFAANPNVSTYMTFLLSRSELGLTDGGIFTIGEVDPDYANVTSQEKLPLVGEPYWSVFMDKVVVNGTEFCGNGLLSNASYDAGFPAEDYNKTIALLDTGTSLGYMPEYYFEAIYGQVENLTLVDASQGLYSLPCDTKLNVSMMFGGVEYSINPLDLTYVTMSPSNATICASSFSPTNVSVGVDFILGDSFLRNVYSLFNFGNWTTAGDEAPYVQLLSATNQTQAWEDFERLNAARIMQFNELGGQVNITSSNTTSA